MGAVAGRLSDLIVITSDNPRGEDPGRIIEEIRRGITRDTRRDRGQRLLLDRRSARGDRRRDRAGSSRRPRADRRQGTREVSGHRRLTPPVRRCGGGAGGARSASQQLRCRLRRACCITSCSRCTRFSVLNVTHYITFRTAAASLSALAISLVLGPWMVRKLREFQIGQVIRQEGPTTHRAKAGTPTMGGLLILTAALVPTLLWADLTQRLRVDRCPHDRVVRRHRLRRRLPEDRPADASRPAAALQDGPADPDRAAGRRRAAGAGAARRLQHPADLSVLQAADSRSRAGGICRSRSSCWSRRRTP